MTENSIAQTIWVYTKELGMGIALSVSGDIARILPPFLAHNELEKAWKVN